MNAIDVVDDGEVRRQRTDRDAIAAVINRSPAGFGAVSRKNDIRCHEDVTGYGDVTVAEI